MKNKWQLIGISIICRKGAVKNEEESDSEEDVKSEQESSAEEESGSEEGEEMDEGEDSEEDEAPKRPPRPSDVQEGCTIFLKNVPFTATQEELRECMLKFGPVVYALICTDPLTEHSRGTAFVKFQVNRENSVQIWSNAWNCVMQKLEYFE